MSVARLSVALVACFIVMVQALPTEDGRALNSHTNSVQNENDLLDSIYSECARKDSASCVKYKVFSFVDKLLGQKETFTLAEGVTVVKKPSAEADGAPRALDTDASIEVMVMDRLINFLETHTLKVDLKGSDIVGVATSAGRALEDAARNFVGDDALVEESRGKKKKAQKMLGPLMMAVALKAAALVPLMLGGIALIAGKALLIGKIALVISAIIGLKKLLSGGGKHVTYEVVAHPHHSSSHSSSHGGDTYAAIGGSSGFGSDAGGYGGGGSSGHGGWGRSADAQDLAYSAQKPQQL